MNAIKLLADSTSDLTEELVRKHSIGIIPLYVNFGLKSYKDNVDITPKELYARVAESGTLPTTSAPTPEDYQKEFDKHIKKGNDIIYISISAKLSSSYQNACTAAALFPAGRIKVIDSLNLSTGIGLLVLIADDCIKSGLEIAQTAEIVQLKIDKVESTFALDTAEYLHKGGRASGLQMFFSSLLQIHPILKTGNGSIHLAAKVRGGRKQILEHMLKTVTANVDKIDPARIFVPNTECLEDARWLQDQISQLKYFKEVIITEAGCVICTHCGPKTIGIMYLKK